MDWVSRFAVPAMIILMLWSLLIAWGDVGGYAKLQALQPAGEIGVGEALTVIISTFVIAYILASAIAYFSPGIKPINGIITAALIYWLVGSVLKNSSKVQT